MSIDPVTFLDTGSPSMFNRYMYGNNDPVNTLDPDGRQSVLFGLEVGVGVGEGNLGVTATHAFIRETSPDATQSDLRRSARHGEVRTEKALGKQIHTHTPYQGNPSCTTGACESFYDSIEKLD